MWASLPCTGGSTWSHLNLTLEGNREKVIAARKLFTKLRASFVDLSSGLDRIGVHYAIEWPKNCVYWSWDRIRKWLESHNLSEVTLDGCWVSKIRTAPLSRIATSCKSIIKAFKNKTCRGGHSHAKCLKESEDYTPKFAFLVHQAFALQAAERRQNRCAVAALTAQPALPAEIMASSSSAAAFLAEVASPDQELMQSNMRRFLQHLDENRPAGARANKQTPSWLEPPADADAEDRVLGIIPVAQWRELWEEFPSMAWIMLVGRTLVSPVWSVDDDPQSHDHRHHPGGLVMPNEGVHRGRVSAGLGVQGSKTRSWLRRSMTSAIVSSSTRAQALGSYPIFAETVELLAKFYTPAFERIPPPEVDQESFVIVGDSALALCTPGNQRNTIRAKHTCIDRLRPYVGSTVMDTRWGKDLQTLINGVHRARIQLPDEGVPGFHLILVWSGNDVYGTYGYLGFTWHHVHPWVMQTEEMKKKAEHWPAKQKARVLQSVEEVIRLRQEPYIKSVTVVI